MGTPEAFCEEEPCPDRILDDIGYGFCLGGAAFHLLKGTYNSPSGARLIGAAQAVRMNTPRVAGTIAVYQGLLSAFHCVSVYIRQKEDPWNSIISGAAAMGFGSMRQGFAIASKSALVGGFTFALLEGSSIMAEKLFSQPQKPIMIKER